MIWGSTTIKIEDFNSSLNADVNRRWIVTKIWAVEIVKVIGYVLFKIIQAVMLI